MNEISFDSFCSYEHLLRAWGVFARGKMGRPDVSVFYAHLEDNILALSADLLRGSIVSDDVSQLREYAVILQKHAQRELCLSIPNSKITVRRLSQGCDVLGEVLFPYGAVPRRRTVHKAFQSTRDGDARALISYIGLLSHTQSFCLQSAMWYGV